MRQFRTFVSDQLNVWGNVFISCEKGLIDDPVWEGYDEFYSSQLRLPSYRLVWDMSKDGWTGRFASHVEAALAGQP